jgi:transposase-like protein
MNALNAQVACRAPRLDAFARPNCPRCGSVVHLAERSAFNLDGRIRHSWACDECGEEFTTSISVLPAQV